VGSRGDVLIGVRRKALALGSVGERWLDDLDVTLDGLEADWDCRIGAPIAGEP
jgi:hypothetical protein